MSATAYGRTLASAVANLRTLAAEGAVASQPLDPAVEAAARVHISALADLFEAVGGSDEGLAMARGIFKGAERAAATLSVIRTALP